MTSQTQTPPPPNPSPCQWCNREHSSVCPHVAAIEYFPNGKVRRVEFRRMADYLAPLHPGPLRPIPPVTSETPKPPTPFKIPEPVPYEPPATAPWEPYRRSTPFVLERKPGEIGPITRFGSGSAPATMEDWYIMQARVTTL